VDIFSNLERRNRKNEKRFINHAHRVHDDVPAGGHSINPNRAGADQTDLRQLPPCPTFPCVQMERWKVEVEKRTGGKVAVQTFPGSTLLNPKNMFEGVVSGTADIGCLAMSYQPGRFPVSEAIDQPVGFQVQKPRALLSMISLKNITQRI